MRIAANELSVTDVNVARQLSGHGHNAAKSRLSSTLAVPDAAQRLFAEGQKAHVLLRKRLSGVYPMSSMLKFEKYIQDCFDLML